MVRRELDQCTCDALDEWIRVRLRKRRQATPDAKWNWDATKKGYYWGYGRLLAA